MDFNRKIRAALSVSFLLLHESYLANPTQANGPIFFEEWENIPGTEIEYLINDTTFPDNATTEGYQLHMGLEEESFSKRHQMGMRMRSYFLAPMNGDYVFYTACDDSCRLFLSSNVNPKNKQVVVDQAGKVAIGALTSKSLPQSLREGKLYYMELLYKEDGGLNYANITIKIGDKFESPIASEHFRRTVRGIDLPGKDCRSEGDPRYPNYLDCKKFTQTDKLQGVKTAIQELQEKLKNTSHPSEKQLEDTMKTAGRKITFLLDDSTIQSEPASDNEGLAVTREVEELGDMVARAVNSSTPIVMQYPSVIMQIKELERGFSFPADHQKNSFATSDQIRIEKSHNDAEKYVVFSALYKNLENILQRNISTVEGDEEKGAKFFLNSRIIVSSMVPRPTNMEKGGIHVRLEHTMHKRTKETVMTCAFWNFTARIGNTSGAWSRKGCRVDVKKSDMNNTVCRCDHLTHFAILMKVSADEKPLSKGHRQALESITYVGCSLSLIGELLTVLAIIALRLTRSETNIIHLNLVVALGLSQLFFLAGIRATWNRGLCIFVASALHFFNLVAFCWMLVEGVWLYVMVVRVFDTGYNRIKRYIIAAWTIPAVIVIITLASSFDGYGTDFSCWLSVEKGTIWSFVVPVLVIVLANATILGMVVREILQLHTPTPADDSKISMVRSGVKSAMVLLPILGVTWVFGVLAVNSYTIVFQYVFAIFNSLQGFFIFIFHCLLNSEVRKAFYRKKQIWSESHMFQTNTQTPPHKYDSEACKETQSTSMEKVPKL